MTGLHCHSVILGRQDRAGPCVREMFRKHRTVRPFKQKVKSSNVQANEGSWEFFYLFPLTKLLAKERYLNHSTEISPAVRGI